MEEFHEIADCVMVIVILRASLKIVSHRPCKVAQTR